MLALPPQSWLTPLSPTGLQLGFSSGFAAKARQITTQKRDLPDPGMEPASLALAGRFFTTEPPGKLSTWRQVT
ncbi:hypothetical protein R6Z07F_009132 [Ovis aries]